MDDLPNSVITLMIDDFWEICRKMDNRDRYSLKMEYSNLVKNAINKLNTPFQMAIAVFIALLIILKTPPATVDKNLNVIEVLQRVAVN